MYRNYETSLALICFAEANRDGRYDKLIKNAEKFLKENQWDEAQGQDKSSPTYGGAGYGKHKRPDLSNTQLPGRRPARGGRRPGRRGHARRPWSSSPAARTSKASTTRSPLPAKNPDGGFYYTPAAGGESRPARRPTAACEATAR